jgi:hypothetical protein
VVRYIVRISPDFRAKEFSVGTIKTGNNGKQWVIKLTANNVKRWSPVDVKQKSPNKVVNQKSPNEPEYKYGMFTKAGDKKIESLINHINKRRPKYKWAEVMGLLSKISDNPKFAEAADTHVRETMLVYIDKNVADLS